jgi:signal transduction histidine kinase
MVERTLPEDLPLLAEKVELGRRGIVDHEYEYRLRMPDGSLKYLRTNAYATRDRDGELEFLGVIQDITDRKLAEEALTTVRSDLASMTRAASMGALTASIAHEVNQPLLSVMTNTSTCLRILAKPSPDLDSALTVVNRTARDGKRAADVIGRLRALFSNKKSTIEPIDLNDATREVLLLSRSELQRNSVVVKTELEASLPQLLGDRIQLQQVILNFLLNASEAMLSVVDRPRQLVIRTELDGTVGVQLSVQDGGIGLKPDVVDKLFEAFYTTKPTGMGIGLSISHSIIEAHGGRIWAAPNLTGPGATFFFSIPLQPPDA